MSNCIFCKIINKQIREEILFENENFIVVKDIHPRTSFHLLIITKVHYVDYSELAQKNPTLISEIGKVVELLVEKFDIKASSKLGYTWGFHAGGKESVSHVHAQLLANMQPGELVL